MDRKGIFKIQSLVSADIVDINESFVKCVRIVKALSLRCVYSFDTDVNDNLAKHIIRIISNYQIVVCDPSFIGSKCIMLTSHKCID